MSLVNPTRGELLDRLSIVSLKIARAGRTDLEPERVEIKQFLADSTNLSDPFADPGFSELNAINEIIWNAVDAVLAGGDAGVIAENGLLAARMNGRRAQVVCDINASASYAQDGEDRFVLDCFQPGFKGYACDVGASNGSRISNSLLFEQHGWEVLCIEANPLYYEPLRRARKCVLGVACGSENLDRATFTAYESAPGNWDAASSIAHSAIAMEMTGPLPFRQFQVPIWTLDRCLEHAQFSKLDYLTIDVEGTELDVLHGLSIERWQPTMVVIESWVDGGPVRSYMVDAGYGFVIRIGVNDIFRRKS